MIKEEFSRRKEIIRNRLDDFSLVSENDYFYELCFCLLTPGSKARQAEKVIDFLKEKDFENRPLDFGEELKKVRFHNTKKKRLIDMKKSYPALLREIKGNNDNFRLREYLVENVNGLGYKEASHFLRNIGRENLAILDRHILKNLVKFGALDIVPDSLGRKNYLEIEQKLRQLAKENGLSMDELDLLFWSLETGEVFK